VVRTIEPPDPLPLPSATVLLDRAPYTVAAEVALLREHAVDALVTKNSGGEATVAKLTAARTLGLSVVMVRRPPQPPGPLMTTVDEAEAWLARATLAPTI
jgi:precorrin-6A/cobalt-precorrin-6A reductase